MLFATYIASSSKRYLPVSEMPDKVVLEAAVCSPGWQPFRGIEPYRGVAWYRGHAAYTGTRRTSRLLPMIVSRRAGELRWSGPLDIRWRALSMKSVLFFFFPFARKRAGIRRAYKRQVLECLAKGAGLSATSLSYARTRVNKVGKKNKMDTYLLYRKPPTYIWYIS